MIKKRCTEEQIIGILQEAETGAAIKDLLVASYSQAHEMLFDAHASARPPVPASPAHACALSG